MCFNCFCFILPQDCTVYETENKILHVVSNLSILLWYSVILLHPLK